ncbi:hypothetical protein J4Q44_G00190370 [Coregonus suidteri]|uniref:Uncharacterized protein n=1 Tax=Coregonus suidteri TaxID=861788 RepID=A0AAN8LEX8_9TELE
MWSLSLTVSRRFLLSMSLHRKHRTATSEESSSSSIRDSRMISLPAGIIRFILTKRAVDLKQLRIRLRMNRSNEGSRYHNRLD